MAGFPTDPQIYVPMAAIARKSTNLDDFLKRARTFLENKHPEFFTEEAWKELNNSFGVIDEPEKVAMGDKEGWTTDISSTTVSPELGEGYLSPDVYVAEKLVRPFTKGGEYYAMIDTIIHNRSKEAKVCRPKVTDMLTRETWVGPPMKVEPDKSGMWMGYKIKLKPPVAGDPKTSDHCLIFEAQTLE